MSEDNFSCIKSLTETVHIALPAVFVSNEISGVTEILESWKRQYVQQLKGIVVGYKNVSLVSNSGYIVIDKPFLHYDVKATFDLFYPTIGSIVKGTVNRISPDHIGCLVHGTINVSIHLSDESSDELSDFIHLDREILFQVTHFDFHRKIVRVKGKITPECIRLMKEMFPSHVAFEFSSQHIYSNANSLTAKFPKKNKHTFFGEENSVQSSEMSDKDSGLVTDAYSSPITNDVQSNILTSNLNENDTLSSPKLPKKKKKKTGSKENTEITDISDKATSVVTDIFSNHVDSDITTHLLNTDGSLLPSKMSKKKKHKGGSKGNDDYAASQLIDTDICLKKESYSDTREINEISDISTHLFNASSSPPAKIKKKKHKTSVKENSPDTQKAFHNEVFNINDFEKLWQKIKKEPEETSVSDEKNVGSPNKHASLKRKRERSLSESTLEFPLTESPPKKKKKHKHNKTETEKVLLEKKPKGNGKSKKKDKSKKDGKKSKEGSKNKDKKKKKKPKQGKDQKTNLKDSNNKQKTGIKSKHKKDKKKNHNKDKKNKN